MKDKKDIIKKVRERTGVGIGDLLKIYERFPKANEEELIEILMYVGMAVYHKIPADEKFKHLK